MSRLSRELQLTLQSALREAQVRRHPYMTVEHLLFALLHDDAAVKILRHCGARIDRLKSSLAEFFDHEIESEPGKDEVDTGQTLAFHRVVQSALAHAESADKDEVLPPGRTVYTAGSPQ